MKKIKLVVLSIILILVCSGCKTTYTITYIDDDFKEEAIIEEISVDDQELFHRYDDPGSLIFDENESYTYTDSGSKKVFSYDIGKKLKETPLLKYCFEKVYIVDEKEYINVQTGGEYYCSNNDITLKIETDKKVINHNASSVDGNTYTWEDLKDGVVIQFSKEKLVNDSSTAINKELKNLLIRLLIVVVFIVFLVLIIIYLKRRQGEE